MKKSLFNFFIIALTSFSLVSCNETQEPPRPEKWYPQDEEQEEQKETEETIKGEHLKLTNKINEFLVGETFNNVFDVNLIHVDESGVEKDMSSFKPFYSFKMYDSTNTEVDITKPFSKAGQYKVQAFLTRKTEVVSNIETLNIIEKTYGKITEKQRLPEFFTYDKISGSCNQNLSLPSKGNVDVLVIPCEIPDFPFSSYSYRENYFSAIQKVFNGNGAEDTNYFESVSSFYKKSSLGKLNFTFDIADVFTSPYTSSQLMNYGEVYGSFELGNLALQDYIDKNGAASTQKYDYDKDGYIDGIWFIYSAPDYSKQSYGMGGNLFWAYCTDIPAKAPNLDCPFFNSYGWASMSFIDAQKDAQKVDAHTIIHETGHLLGLPDYYSYDIESAVASGSQGGLAMMDLNIGDHDPFSKMALGWNNPYVVTENCEITIKSNGISGDSIILADNWNGTAFDEYVLFDFVTPDGLNSIDSKQSYEGTRPLLYTKPGVRAYHVDARLGEFKFFDGQSLGAVGVAPLVDEDSMDCYMSDDSVKKVVKKGIITRVSQDSSIPFEQRDSGYDVINYNCATRTKIQEPKYKNNRLLTLMSKDKTNFEVNDAFANNNTLFVEEDSFSINNQFSGYFTNSDLKLNNGNPLKWVVSIISMSDTEATLRFRKY